MEEEERKKKKKRATFFDMIASRDWEYQWTGIKGSNPLSFAYVSKNFLLFDSLLHSAVEIINETDRERKRKEGKEEEDKGGSTYE